jgi:hypothetical protein
VTAGLILRQTLFATLQAVEVQSSLTQGVAEPLFPTF